MQVSYHPPVAGEAVFSNLRSGKRAARYNDWVINGNWLVGLDVDEYRSSGKENQASRV